MDTCDALDVSLEAIRSLRGLMQKLRGRDADLARQVRRAASSVPLNIAEGRRRVGKDRLHFFRIAAGSAAEVRVALRTAEAWGDLTERETAPAQELLDRVGAMLWRMTR